MKTVNQKGLCYEVWNFKQENNPCHTLLVWCQFGSFCKENVNDVLESQEYPHCNVCVAINEQEDADIPAFISKSISDNKDGNKLIIISYLPWGKDKADDLMSEFDKSIYSIRYEAQAEEWLNMNFPYSRFNQPVIGFLKEHPEYFALPYGERPLKNSAGPSPETWSNVDRMWSGAYYLSKNEWKDRTPESKIRELLLCIADCIGNYEPMTTQFGEYLLRTKGYDNLIFPTEEKCQELDNISAPGQATFTNVFDENGKTVWEQ